ncbi:EamA family transporter [Photobacterium sagamiensis]|uniref:EamA family transporter n=1 Tax=Photobacterium sagamiensis TaxID=2910241 RepID=UPI003D0C8A64
MRPELLVGLGAGIFNAGSQVSLYRVSKGALSPIALNAWCFLLAVGLLLPVLILNSDPVNMQHMLAQMLDLQTLLVPMLVLLAVCIVNTQVFRVKAYQLVESGSQLAPLIFTNLLFSIIWQVLYFDQTLEWNKIAGVGMIVMATLFNTFLPSLQRLLKQQNHLKQQCRHNNGPNSNSALLTRF